MRPYFRHYSYTLKSFRFDTHEITKGNEPARQHSEYDLVYTVEKKQLPRLGSPETLKENIGEFGCYLKSEAGDTREASDFFKSAVCLPMLCRKFG